jgi:hypothetical protein
MADNFLKPFFVYHTLPETANACLFVFLLAPIVCVSAAAQTFVTITLPLLVPTASVYVGLYKLALLGASQSIHLCSIALSRVFTSVCTQNNVLIRFVILIMVSLSHRRRLFFISFFSSLFLSSSQTHPG